ncbi:MULTISPECIES: hypothetical protein [unclassified Nocardioides]|uniref:hypothetical protein n=1 Tax=Nocardioides sp. ChNu-99 TaxID=2839897 RepID=UPI0024070108|nr:MULTISPECIES: hypothetical protein [unclassified Nocardioides]
MAAHAVLRAAIAATSATGSTTPWAYDGALTATSTVRSASAATAARVAATSARKSGPTGTTTVSTPK